MGSKVAEKVEKVYINDTNLRTVANESRDIAFSDDWFAQNTDLISVCSLLPVSLSFKKEYLLC